MFTIQSYTVNDATFKSNVSVLALWKSSLHNLLYPLPNNHANVLFLFRFLKIPVDLSSAPFQFGHPHYNIKNKYSVPGIY